MKIILHKKLLLFLVFFLFVNKFVGNAQTIGIYESYLILNTNNSGLQYYDLQADTGNPDFINNNLGTFNSSNTLVLAGAQNKTFKCDGGDVTGANVFFRIYPINQIPITAVFSGIDLPFSSNDAGGCGGNQTWQRTDNTTNVLENLSAGDYYFEVYTNATGFPGTVFSSNNSFNFRATFTFNYPPIVLISLTSYSFGNLNVSTFSASQTINLSGDNLTGFPNDLTVTAPNTNFQVSTDDVNWNSSITIPYTTKTLNSTPLYIRFSPQSVGLKSGNISITGGGLYNPVTIAVTGRGLDSTTWQNDTWTNGIPTLDINAIIADDLSLTSDIEAFTLTVNSGFSLIVTAGTTLHVENEIINNSGYANFIVENDGIILQDAEVTNQGAITVKRNSSNLYRQDYTFWSSPVLGQNLRSFSPQTLFNRFYIFDTSSSEFVQKFNTSGSPDEPFTIPQGYLIRMPNNWPVYVNDATPGTPFLGSFVGVPNNGEYTIALPSSTYKYHLVGNPYPSSLSITDFFTGNPDIEVKLYLYRKRNGVAGSGYATWTNLGIAGPNQPPGLEINGIIKSGQGFFIQSNTATELVITNEMRSNTTSGTVFFKSQQTNEIEPERHRIWLNLSQNNIIIGQTLVGFMTNATTGFDSGIDATYFNDSPVALTSLIGENEYAIQSKGLPFQNSTFFNLGFKTDVTGNYTISLADFDGLFQDQQNIYLKDNATGTFTDLKISPYVFTTELGIFNSRFELRFDTNLDNTKITQPNSVVVWTDENSISIDSKDKIGSFD